MQTINQIKYSLSKQLDEDFAPMEINTNYGEIPLTDEDIIEIRTLLRKRFTAKLEKARPSKISGTLVLPAKNIPFDAIQEARDALERKKGTRSESVLKIDEFIERVTKL